jgi:hypothetical protein
VGAFKTASLRGSPTLQGSTYIVAVLVLIDAYKAGRCQAAGRAEVAGEPNKVLAILRAGGREVGHLA